MRLVFAIELALVNMFGEEDILELSYGFLAPDATEEAELWLCNSKLLRLCIHGIVLLKQRKGAWCCANGWIRRTWNLISFPVCL